MKSRYDYMTASSCKDTDGDAFPDPLSVDYSAFALSTIPRSYEMTRQDIDKFWVTMYRNYGIAYYDDLLLSLNGVPYIGMLDPGDRILLITKSDMENFMSERKGA